jgi:hypothetical protein
MLHFLIWKRQLQKRVISPERFLLHEITMSAAPLHRYIYFYQSENALAFAATTSGIALVIDRTTTGISLQRMYHHWRPN